MQQAFRNLSVEARRNSEVAYLRKKSFFSDDGSEELSPLLSKREKVQNVMILAIYFTIIVVVLVYWKFFLSLIEELVNWMKEYPGLSALGVIGFYVGAAVFILPQTWLQTSMGYICSKALDD